KPWGTPTIVAVSIFAFFVLALGITLLAFWFHKRADRKKLPPSHRENAAPTPESDDKASMFSRDRGASVSLYVDPDIVDTRRKSTEAVSLVPLQVTPVDETRDPADTFGSTGSGVSAMSRGSSRYSATTGGSLGMSGISVPEEEGESDLSVRRTRPRSTSTLSTRYYDNGSTSSPSEPMPQIPKIVHTPS
ncbi:hypothetical protein BCR34DRAFT_459868, partial [Clohesyomyces aquaticus]